MSEWADSTWPTLTHSLTHPLTVGQSVSQPHCSLTHSLTHSLSLSVVVGLGGWLPRSAALARWLAWVGHRCRRTTDGPDRLRSTTTQRPTFAACTLWVLLCCAVQPLVGVVRVRLWGRVNRCNATQRERLGLSVVRCLMIDDGARMTTTVLE